MRQLILDTETTGLVPEAGHRIIEIGCVELVDRRFTGNDYHQYINPERESEADALQVHGITSKFLADKPLFKEISAELLEYLKDAELIIHNAPFDIGFLNYEFKLLDSKFTDITNYTTVVDTLTIARKRHPGKKNNLDALCKRYQVDNSGRKLHGAMLDATLLAEVYLAMTGGQMSLFGGESGQRSELASATTTASQQSQPQHPTPIIYATPEELAAHSEFLELFKVKKGS